MDSPLKLLAIFPHPDDETLGLGSTFARYAAEGIETHLVCATHGEMGWYDSDGPNPGFEGVGLIRTKELNCASENLGLHSVNFLDYIDGYVDKAKSTEIIGKLVTHIRRIKPQVVVTFAPDGAYGHPDHIALSQFTNGALVCAADKSFIDADKQVPHRVSKFYYMVDSLDVVQAANDAFGGISMDVDGVTRHHQGWEDWQITTVLDNTKHMIPVQLAIQCHKSQLPGYGPIGEWSVAELTRVFGTGHFYRAFSLVNNGRKVEHDLFEGLR
jgi:LmbE family N-acetylglucosaminyl deacetylase